MINLFVNVVNNDGMLNLLLVDESCEVNVLLGMMCVIIVNVVYGVIKGFECKLMLVGVGYCV